MKRVILFMIATSFLFCGCKKDNSLGSVYGTVTVEGTGKLLINTAIELCDLHGTVLGKTVTDEKASYTFSNISQGLYQLKVIGEISPYAHVFKILPGEYKLADILVHMIEEEWIELPSMGIAVQGKDIGRGSLSAVSTACENSVLGNFSDWRLPTISELMTIYTNRNSIGGFNDNYNDCYYWSATSYSFYSNDYYIIRFHDGGQRTQSKENQAYGRCVRTL